MTRRLMLFALMLAALPLFAKRRAVMAGATEHCTTGVLATQIVTSLMATDDRYVYWYGSARSLYRVPKHGGVTRRLAVIENGGPQGMVVDDTHVYLAVRGFDPAAPRSGAIIAIPRGGGAVSTLVPEIDLPGDIEIDDTHVYWVDTGEPDYERARIVSRGRIERARKDGSGRETLAGNLAVPYHLALDGDRVWFSESGFTRDGERGLHVVPKSGGAVTTIDDDITPAGITPSGDSLVVWGFTSDVENAIFVYDRNGRRILVEDRELTSRPRVFDGVAYYLSGNHINRSTLWSLPVAGGAPALLYNNVSAFMHDVAVDSCAITFRTASNTIVRLKR